MPIIILKTIINAPVDVCYKLSLNVDLHQISTSKIQEKIVGGKSAGILSLGDSVTWKAKHFGIWQTLTVKITEANPPHYFADEMLKGVFQSMRHEHFFEPLHGSMGTLMQDKFHFMSPFGIIGQLFDFIVLERYMKLFLKKRNQVIKNIAESGNYSHFI